MQNFKYRTSINELMRLSVCYHNNSERCGRILVKFFEGVGSTTSSSGLDFGDDPGNDADQEFSKELLTLPLMGNAEFYLKRAVRPWGGLRSLECWSLL